MDKEQRQRMANQTFIRSQEDQEDIEYTVRVSGQRVELVESYDAPWDDEHGTGPDTQVSTWVMDVPTLKRLVQAAQWCIEKSEAFEKSHPLPSGPEVAPAIDEQHSKPEPGIIQGKDFYFDLR